MATTQNCRPKRRPQRNNQIGFPHFGNIINELMNTSMGDVITHKNIQYSKPLVNVKESDSNYRLDITLPGFTKSDVNIAIEKNVLIISSEKKNDTDQKFRLREFNYGVFERKFNLPENAKADQITAEMKDGVLSINIEKKDPESLKPKQITIK